MKPSPSTGSRRQRELFNNIDEMYVIVTYDVDKKRCAKVMKYLRQWLEHRQRSVFAGHLNNRQLKQLKHGLLRIIKPHLDSVIVFSTRAASMQDEWLTHAASLQRYDGVILSTHVKREMKKEDKEQDKPRPSMLL